MLYRILILLHLLGVVTFFSNAVAALFWKSRADRSRDAMVVAHSFRTLVAGDLWITPISSALIVTSGLGAARLAGLPILGTGWVLWSIVAFAASGAVFAISVYPRQRRLAAWTAADVAGGNFDWDRYEVEARRWSHSAHLSLLLAGLAMVLMVLRPSL